MERENQYHLRIVPGSNAKSERLAVDTPLYEIPTTGTESGAMRTRTRADLEASGDASDTCPNCRGADHALRDCVWTGNDPQCLLRGCVLCNRMDHLTDVCPKFVVLSDKKKKAIYINKRENMPGLATTTGTWWEKVWPVIREDPRKQARLPWTPSFAKKVLKLSPVSPVEKAMFELIWSDIEEFGSTLERGLLPKDPATKTHGRFVEAMGLKQKPTMF